MADFPLKGMGVAIVTPFKADKSVDFDALSLLLDFHIESGTEFLVALGTTAETATLTMDEQNQIVRFIVQKVKGKLPVVVGMGSNDTQGLIKSIKTFDFQGVHSVLSVTPYYSKPTQEGLYQHFVALSEVSPIPIILYNVPGRTGVNMTAQTTLRIAHECKNVIGIKDAHSDIEQVKAIVKSAPEGFHVLSGDDAMTVDFIKEGAVGVISVLGNAFPKEFKSIVHAALNGECDMARDAYKQLMHCCELLFVEGNPAGVKCVLYLLGYLQNYLRLPLTPVSAATEKALKHEIETCV